MPGLLGKLLRRWRARPPAPEPEPDRGNAPGWFGKIPALGDFASRRLAPGFIESWDEWLSAGIAAARETLAADWESRYDASGACRFVLGPGVFDAHTWYGLLQPNRDRVGRRFPLTIAAACEALPPDIELRWQRMAEIAARTREAECDAEALEEMLLRELLPGSHEASTTPDAPVPLTESGRSLWWTARTHTTGDAPLRIEGMPAGDRFLELFTP